ncbi:TRAF-type zinc finger domain-containing protein 1 isoform X1 [Sarcophilus harrisii]|uniref:TRAF-type zinc finger domain-containing protein 1 n=1 Tax=Sarcophilus harrisii TaxID=9305 RepID=G3W5B0_SARHA|nr:TRAF-type zinc finger domain-containing protein 1 isoform X1 [Sarcophilus harrisii]
MAEVIKQETQLCDNCKREIPMPNFTIHEIHCRRNIGVCHVCKEPVPKSEMKAHMELEHSQVTCKCNMKMERRQLANHETLECPLRLAVCQHCELELAFLKLKDHEDYCGARTELCSKCGRNIMVKDLKAHPEVCGKEGEGKREARARPAHGYESEEEEEEEEDEEEDEEEEEDGAWFIAQTVQNMLGPDHPSRSLQRLSRSLEEPFYSRLLADQLARTPNRGAGSTLQPEQNRAEKQERLVGRKSQPSPPASGNEDAHLDYMLALSLQSESGAPSSTVAHLEDFWRAVCAEDLRQAQDTEPFLATEALKESKNEETMLPCEFCEELYPEEDLILHQTGCNPASALASFSKRSSPPSLSQDRGDREEQLQRILDLPATRASSGRLRSLLDLSAAPSGESSVIIPCEFCGVQLEEEVLFHHQDQCDLRPGSTVPVEWLLPACKSLPKQDNLQPETSPELPRRRVRHQGDLSSCYLDDIRQEAAGKATYPLPPSRPASSIGLARNRLSKGVLDPRPGLLPSPPRVLKASNLESLEPRAQSRKNHSPAAGPISALRPARGLYPENYVPSFPRIPPVRHGLSVRNEVGRNSRITPTAANFRNRTTKTKSPKPAAGDAEEEEE